MKTPSERTLAKFEKIADDAIKAAEAIPCRFDEFVEGLQAMERMILDRLSVAVEEQGGG